MNKKVKMAFFRMRKIKINKFTYSRKMNEKEEI